MSNKKEAKKRVKIQTLILLFFVSLSLVLGVSLLYALSARNFATKTQESISTAIVPVSTDPVLANELRAFLLKEATKSGCTTERPAYEHLVFIDSARTQGLVRHGCGAADTPMYIKKKDGAWTTISPTNMFSTLPIPSCSLADQHAISPELAPVCAKNLASETTEYIIR